MTNWLESWHLVVMAFIIAILSFHTGATVERRKHAIRSPEHHAKLVWPDDDPEVVVDDGITIRDWWCEHRYRHWWSHNETVFCHRNPPTWKLYEETP